MISLFIKRLSRPKSTSTDDTASQEIAAGYSPTIVNQMTLQERKQWRQETLYQSVRESLLRMEVLASMYRVKVKPVDDRHHRFAVMVDMAKSFITSHRDRPITFGEMEHLMRQQAYAQFGVLIVGVYWRVSESAEPFAPNPRISDAHRPDGVNAMSYRNPSTQQSGLHRNNVDKRDINRFEPLNSTELTEFRDALARGVTLPAIRVGTKEYQSDLVPLDSGNMISST